MFLLPPVDSDGSCRVLQVYIRILDNEWNVYRRYAEFRELHNHLRAQFPQVDGFNFPPKKAIGNKVGGRGCTSQSRSDLHKAGRHEIAVARARI